MYIYVHMGKRFSGGRLIQWGVSPLTVSRFRDFCEAKGALAHKQMEFALERYMDTADEDTKRQIAKVRRRRRRDAAANTR